MTPEETSADTAKGIGAFGARWMLSKRTFAVGEALGYGPFEQYFCARGGVLGPAPATVVHAAFGFFEEALVRSQWNAGTAKGPLEPLLVSYERCCADAARHFGTDLDWSRLGELAERVVRAGSPAGNPLFAGWRDRALDTDPSDAPRRGGLLLNALREFRGGSHLMALRAAGVDLVHAVLISGGEANAALFGIHPPYPEFEASRQGWEAAETATNRMVAAAFSALNESELEEFSELVEQFHAAFR